MNTSELRAVAGIGQEQLAIQEKAQEDINSFLNRIDEIWDEEVIPFGILVGLQLKIGEGYHADYEERPTFVITKDIESEQTIIWRSIEESHSICIDLDPIIIDRNKNKISAYSVVNAPQLVSETYSSYINDYNELEIADDGGEYLIEKIHEPLMVADIEKEHLNLVAVSHLTSLINLDKGRVTVFDWRSVADDSEEGDNYY